MPALIVLAVAGSVIAIAIAARRRRREAWREAAHRLGLRFCPAGLFGRDQITGVRDGFRIVIDTFTSSHGQSSSNRTRFVVHADGAFSDSLTLKREGLGSSLKKLFIGEDIEIDDRSFDHAVLVGGDEAEAVARLDHATRGLVASWLDRRHKVADGQVYSERPGHLSRADAIVSRANSTLAIAAGLASDRRPLPELLARNARQEPSVRVRRRNALLLFERYPDSEHSRVLARELIASPEPDPKTALAAGIALGAEALDRIAALLADRRGLGPVDYCKGLEHLATREPQAERTTALLAASLEHPWERVQRAAVEILIQRGKLAAVRDRLLAMAPAVEVPETAAVVARALGHLEPSADLEFVLLGLLDQDATEVQTAAARSLGLNGSLAAVEPLLAKSKGLLVDGDLKHVARAAIDAIQARAGDARPGGLSVVCPEPEAGALSEPERDGGELSLGPEQEQEPGVRKTETE